MDIATLGLRVDASGAVRELRTFDAALVRTGTEGEAVAGKLKTSLSGVGSTIRTLGPLFAASVAIGAFKKTIDETIEAQNAMAQLEAAIKSTGGAAGLTVRQLDDLSGALQQTSTYSDEAVKGAEAILLTFTHIRNAEFSQATQAVVDLATRMGGDLKGAALQVGKALEDPVRGITALRRAGVSFSADQLVVIKRLVETGQAVKAQQMILAELTKEFGGSAEAARGTLGGALTGLKNSFGDLFEQTEQNTASTVRFINKITEALGAWQKFANRNVGPTMDQLYKALDYPGMAPVVIHGHADTPEEKAAAEKAAAHTKALRELIAQQTLEYEKQVALNKAFGQGAIALDLLGLRYDAQLEKARNATDYRGRELAQINALTDKILLANEAAALMADAKERQVAQDKELIDVAMKLARTAGEVADEWKKMADVLSIHIDIDALRASIKRNVEDALDADAAAKKYKRDMETIWKQGLAKILTDGTKSFRDFFEDVLQMFTRMMARMEQEGKTKGFGYKMLGFGSALIGGGVAGYQVGQQAGGATLGALGGAAAGAAVGYQFAGAMGAAIGGLAGFGAGVIGGISASREHAKALRDAMAVFKESMATFHAAATGTTGSLAEQIRQAHAQADALRRGAADQYHPGAWGTSPAQNAAYAATMAQIAADEAAYIERLKEEQRIKNQQFAEDLQVRLLRAQGHEAEANALALKLQQEREYAAAVAAGADAQTLALLQTVQAAEVLKKAMDGLNTTVRNAPSGFKLESYINRFAAGRPWEPPLGMPYNPGRPSMPYPKGGITSGGTTVNVGTVSLSLPNVTTPEKVGPAFMTYIRKVQLQTVGPNAPLADAMEYAS